MNSKIAGKASEEDNQAWKRSVHEAGHFVFCRLLTLNIPTLITIEHSDGTSGRVERMMTDSERLLDAELNGVPFPKVFQHGVSKVQVEAVVKTYRDCRNRLLHYLAWEAIAGIAAENALLGAKKGPRDLAGVDRDEAFLYAAVLAQESHAESWLCFAIEKATAHCSGWLSGPILQVAVRVAARRTLGPAECAELWEELDISHTLKENWEFRVPFVDNSHVEQPLHS